jgi:hypothetical protein
LDVIQKNPYLYQVKHKSVRMGFLKRFPVAVHFTVEEEKIFVHAVCVSCDESGHFQMFFEIDSS